MSQDRILEVKNLKTYFETDEGILKAVDGVSFNIERGEILGIAGESGCGKSVTALSILRLVESPPGKIFNGQIIYNQKQNGETTPIDLVKLDAKGEKMKKIRGNDISIVFQEPMTAFSPVHTVGFQIMESMMIHQNIEEEQARERAIDLLDKVGIPGAATRIDDYPFQLSGGMRQRAFIAMALSCNPSLLIADEPTTAVDVTVQAQLLDLIKQLQKDFNMSVMMITHDLGVIAETADRVAIMYLGKVMEIARVREIFHNPLHPYTTALLESIPDPEGRKKKLTSIEGSVPDLYNIPPGCAFAPRCQKAFDRCRQEMPPMIEKENGHQVRCFLYEEDDSS